MMMSRPLAKARHARLRVDPSHERGRRRSHSEAGMAPRRHCGRWIVDAGHHRVSFMVSRGPRAPQGPQPQRWLCGRSGLKGDVSDWANLAVTLPAEWPSRPVMVSSQ